MDFLEISFVEDGGSSGYGFSEVLAAGCSNGEQTMMSCWSLRLMSVIFDGQALLKQHGLGASSPSFLSLNAVREKEGEEAIYVVVFSRK